MNSPASQTIVQVALPVPVPRYFDYLCPPDFPRIARGTRVLAPLGKRKLVGVVAGEVASSAVPLHRLLPLSGVFDGCKPLLNDELMDLLDWCAAYYKHPAGEVIANALPPALRKSGGILPGSPRQYSITDDGKSRLADGPGRAPAQFALLEQLSAGPKDADALKAFSANWRTTMRRLVEQGCVREEDSEWSGLDMRAGPVLNAEQEAALESIRNSLGGFRCHLLDGVTGSGKTEIYIELMAPLLESGMQVLMLVPEIGLTPQLVRRFSKRLGIAPVVYHSGLSEGQRLAAWAASRSGHARLMLGTRSALFMPMVRPGLIIMDESHDASFKQQDGFRFSARDVAVQRASRLGVPVVLGTATPSLETVNNALQDRYTWSRLRHRATGALSPAWKVMDMRQKPVLGGLLEEVLRDIGEVLEKGEQVLVFLNRRGYAPVLLCHECGWHGACSRCDANLTWHRSARLLACHHCGHRQGVPAMCPECSADALQGAGEGTQQLERFLARRCPGYPMYRFDRDAVSRKGAFEALYEKVRNDGPCLMVGTQMLAKGHHFPLVTRVVIVNPDQSLYSGDYRALERLGQLLVQVAGRAGREDRPGEVILQTHHPDHPLLETLFAEGYEAFARCLLEDRQLAGLPPYSYQAVLRAEATRREPVSDFLEAARDRFSSRTVKVYGPYPAQMEKRGGRMRWYLLLQDDRRPRLQAALDEWVPQIAGLPGARQVRWSLDVDPQEF